MAMLNLSLVSMAMCNLSLASMAVCKLSLVSMAMCNLSLVSMAVFNLSLVIRKLRPGCSSIEASKDLRIWFSNYMYRDCKYAD